MGGGVVIFCSDTMDVVHRVGLSISNEFIKSVLIEIQNVWKDTKWVVAGYLSSTDEHDPTKNLGTSNLQPCG